MKWKKGDRFHYVRMCGGWGNGTVLEVKKNEQTGKTIVIGRLDCQKENEDYWFDSENPNFFKGEATNY